MRILLLGKNGQVGWELQRSLAPLGDVIALDRRGAATDATLCGDLSDLAGLAATVQRVRPDVIVNAAAHTAVDKAESEPELAWLLNAQAPHVLALEAAKLGAWLVHYSTDYVFDGSGQTPWIEADATAPLNVYGRSKCEGESRVRAANPERHLILRTSWVYSARGGNFAKTMLRLSQEREHLTVIDDQWGAPTGGDLLADVTAHMVRHVLFRPEASTRLAGTYHVAASDTTTWHGYAEYVIAQARQRHPLLPIKTKEIQPVPTSAFPLPAQRPHNSRLNTAKLRSTFDLVLPAWQQGVDRMLDEIL